MSLREYEGRCTANPLLPYANVPLVEVGDFPFDSLALMPEAENLEVGERDLVSQSLEDELAPEMLALLDRIETFDEYFHCCGRW